MKTQQQSKSVTRIALAAMAAIVTAAIVAPAQAAPLTTEIPPEVIEGTPMPIKLANLAKIRKTAPS
ncbi:MAG: hypothetical protein HN919_22545, partial [Verrucomicrobia bacterium]|nr:hypothetical protein [Verrucomicrobiota bacterium]